MLLWPLQVPLPRGADQAWISAGASPAFTVRDYRERSAFGRAELVRLRSPGERGSRLAADR